MGSFPFLAVGNEINSSECYLYNTCSRNHQEFSLSMIKFWSVFNSLACCGTNQTSSDPGNLLDAVAQSSAEPQMQSKLISAGLRECDNQANQNELL